MNRFPFIISTLILLFLTNCKEECHGIPGLRSIPFNFFIIDAVTGEHLVTDEEDNNPHTYHKDSLKIFDEHFIEIPVRFIENQYREKIGGYLFSFFNLSRVENIYEADSATYYMYLNSQDTDTISIVYDYEEGSSDCKWMVKEYRSYFNGRLVKSSEEHSYIGVPFEK